MTAPNVFNTVPKPPLTRDLVLEAIFQQEREERQKPTDQYRFVSNLTDIVVYLHSQDRSLNPLEIEELANFIIRLGEEGLLQVHDRPRNSFTFTGLGVERYEAWLDEQYQKAQTHPHHRDPNE